MCGSSLGRLWATPTKVFREDLVAGDCLGLSWYQPCWDVVFIAAEFLVSTGAYLKPHSWELHSPPVWGWQDLPLWPTECLNETKFSEDNSGEETQTRLLFSAMMWSVWDLHPTDVNMSYWFPFWEFCTIIAQQNSQNYWYFSNVQLPRQTKTRRWNYVYFSEVVCLVSLSVFSENVVYSVNQKSVVMFGDHSGKVEPATAYTCETHVVPGKWGTSDINDCIRKL